MTIRFITMEQFHNKSATGSGNIRVRNLLKYWPEADLYKYGEKPDVLIFQKVYVSESDAGLYNFPVTYKGGIKILDLCDPDWMYPPYRLKATVDGVDALTCSSKAIAQFVQQITDKPVRVIKDRFDLTQFPEKKTHKGEAKDLVWFGYSHNSDVLRGIVFYAKKKGLKLTVVSNDDPQAWQFIGDESFRDSYKYIKWSDNAYEMIQRRDIAVLPKGSRPVDRFKSNNRTTVARLLGLPVATSPEDIERLMAAEERNKEVDKWYTKTQKAYDVQVSIEEYKTLIKEISQSQGKLTENAKR